MDKILSKKPEGKDYISNVRINNFELILQFDVKGTHYTARGKIPADDLARDFEGILKDRFFKMMVEMAEVILTKHTEYPQDIAVWQDIVSRKDTKS